MVSNSSYMLFSGRSHPQLAKEIGNCLGISLGKIHIESFPDGEIDVQILENVRGRDVFVVQSVARDPNLYLMELLILIDAFKRASAKSIIAILSYYGYCRQDRKDKGRVPITAKLVANLLEKAGATRVLTMDLHAQQIQGFFDVPVDDLYARPLFAEAIKKLCIKECVVVAPDVGGVKLARALANDLKCGLAIVDKRRIDAEKVEMSALIGDVEGKDVILVDDIYSTGGTLKGAALVCKEAKAKKVYAAITHGLMSEDGLIGSAIDQLFITNTIPLPKGFHSPQLQVVSVAKLFAKAIQSIVEAKSIMSLFESP